MVLGMWTNLTKRVFLMRMLSMILKYVDIPNCPLEPSIQLPVPMTIVGVWLQGLELEVIWDAFELELVVDWTEVGKVVLLGLVGVGEVVAWR